MTIGYFSLGVVILILIVTIRLSVNKQKSHTSVKMWDIFKFPQKGNTDDLYMSAVQIMGTSWILLGIFWTIVEKRYSLSTFMFTIEFLCLLSPIVIGACILKFVLHQWNKKV